MTIEFIKEDTGEYIKQWPNWVGVIPVIGDVVSIHFGDYNEEEVNYEVSKRIISGIEPDKVIICVI